MAESADINEVTNDLSNASLADSGSGGAEVKEEQGKLQNQASESNEAGSHQSQNNGDTPSDEREEEPESESQSESPEDERPPMQGQNGTHNQGK